MSRRLMKGRRPARRNRPVRRPRPVWYRIGGYGGAVLLAAAAVAVLLMPLLDDRTGAGATGARGPASPSAAPTGGQAGAPGGTGPGSPTRPTPQQNGQGETYPGGAGGGPEIPEQNGPAELSWCPRGTAYYRAVRDGVDVVITVSSSGALRAEMSLDGGRSASQQTTVKGGGPHTFHFRGVPPGLVQRVKVTTVSVGVAMQTCYARVAA
ncbi:hypothetical protein ETD83_13560 [Actinomadura soli]|uniref:Uncharacterized protein n=1 Tax=Actinomadura soli TaxID=2508997 RepID=A0A5C4JEJ5_9ACTN|nr:hypothetical protein [Actinomadura soli]TMR01882.1 hypothetical protein ETD83_13560 [Actinomadura soli]